MIVCTRNRASRLPRFLSAVGGLEPVPFGWELLIVDHASTDDTARIIQKFAASATFPIRPLHAAAGALSHAKNQAIAASRGEILAFTDDDCYPRADYLLALADVFQAHDVGVLGGRVVRHDPTDANVSIRDVDTPTSIEPCTFVPPGTVHGANLAVRREVLAAIGGFDPLLGPGTPCVAAEDIELVARAVWAGWRGRYDPAPVVSHHHGRKPGEEADRVRRGYDYGRGAYYTKFMLDSRSRRVYLRGWYETSRRRPRAVARERVRRELAGGGRYLRQRMLRGEPLRRLEAARS
jgi:glycosyltransferase involved in cell wall biosynthesis